MGETADTTPGAAADAAPPAGDDWVPTVAPRVKTQPVARPVEDDWVPTPAPRPGRAAKAAAAAAAAREALRAAAVRTDVPDDAQPPAESAPTQTPWTPVVEAPVEIGRDPHSAPERPAAPEPVATVEPTVEPATDADPAPAVQPAPEPQPVPEPPNAPPPEPAPAVQPTPEPTPQPEPEAESVEQPETAAPDAAPVGKWANTPTPPAPPASTNRPTSSTWANSPQAPTPPTSQATGGSPTGTPSPSAPVSPGEITTPIPAPRKPRRRRRGLRILIAALVVAVAAAGGGVWWWTNNGGDRMTAPVAAYLSAVADGRSADALALLAAPPTSTTLLTDQVLAASTKAAPITEVAVTLTGVNQVTATFKADGKPVTMTIPITQVDGRWKVADGLAEITIPNAWPVTVNGTPAGASRTLTVFPGTYTVASTSGYLSYGTVPAITVGSVAASTVTLTDPGKTAIVAGWKATIDECLKRQDLQPAGCPFGVALTPGWTAKPETISWTMSSDPLAQAQPVATARAGVFEASVTLPVTVKATYVGSGREVPRTDPNPVTVTMTADVTTTPITTSWHH